MAINLDGAQIEFARDLPVAADEVIAKGDMVWWDAANTTLKPASDFTFDTDGPTTRKKFKVVFAGVAMEDRRAGDAKGTIRVAVIALLDSTIISRALVPGELLGPDDASSLLVNQVLERQQDPSECIAEAARDHTTAVTVTKVLIRGNLMNPHARANTEKRTLSLFTSLLGTARDIITDMKAGELFGGPVEILAISSIETVVFDTANTIITIDKGATGLATLTILTAGSAIGKVTRKDLTADANRFFDSDDTFTLKGDGGTTAGEAGFVIEYRPQ